MASWSDYVKKAQEDVSKGPQKNRLAAAKATGATNETTEQSNEQKNRAPAENPSSPDHRSGVSGTYRDFFNGSPRGSKEPPADLLARHRGNR